ncbi:hypothetical protein, partial [Tahibacter caeni]|uniref:hypothetical protein n=1 Tax=Tahibacter caeni TaxID=1453545 RepID=UPI002147BF0D
MTPGLLLGWLCSVVLGAAIWLAVAGWPRRAGDFLAGAGHAVVLGFLATGLLVGLQREPAGAQLFAAVVPLLATATAVFAGIAFWRQ